MTPDIYSCPTARPGMPLDERLLTHQHQRRGLAALFRRQRLSILPPGCRREALEGAGIRGDCLWYLLEAVRSAPYESSRLLLTHRACPLATRCQFRHELKI